MSNIDIEYLYSALVYVGEAIYTIYYTRSTDTGLLSSVGPFHVV